jgi:hypothetical protein
VHYEIMSSSGSLDSENWSSLDSRENNDPFGDGWEEADASCENLLAELNLLESTVLSTGHAISLGYAFQPGGTRDLTFRFTTADGRTHRGIVDYLQSGDYNRDGTVDAADYVLWKKIVGIPVPPGAAADGNGDGVIDVDDFNVFAWSFDNMAATAPIAGSLIGVPEPASRLSLFLVSTYLIQHLGERNRRLRR